MNDLPVAVANELNDLAQHYTDFVRLEKGQNGYVVLARNKISHADVAIKFYANELGQDQHNEPRLLSKISSDNVLRIYEARSVGDGWAYFITERGTGGDLEKLLESGPSFHRCIDMLIGICNGVSAIHACGMIHRDLKPENIVIKRGIPLIADFGSVRELQHGAHSMPASGHSILFRPPESFATNAYSKLGDIYQIGLVAYKLVGGFLPYDGEHYLNIRDKRQYDDIDDIVDKSIFIDSIIRRKAEIGALTDFSTLPPWISISAKHHLRKLLSPSPDRRVSTLSEAAAIFNNVRSQIKDWSWQGKEIIREINGGVISIRHVNDDCYAAYRNIGSGFRRVPKLPMSTQSDLISIIDANPRL